MTLFSRQLTGGSQALVGGTKWAGVGTGYLGPDHAAICSGMPDKSSMAVGQSVLSLSSEDTRSAGSCTSHAAGTAFPGTGFLSSGEQGVPAKTCADPGLGPVGGVPRNWEESWVVCILCVLTSPGHSHLCVPAHAPAHRGLLPAPPCTDKGEAASAMVGQWGPAHCRALEGPAGSPK